uniref:Uncharacterized protein n=1 Tax=Tetranychus urticae TaxID=32264 RepID=T1L4B0_TETUR
MKNYYFWDNPKISNIDFIWIQDITTDTLVLTGIFS